MQNVVSLHRLSADSAVLRKLPHLSPDTMRFVLAILTYRSLTGRTGLVRMSEIGEVNGLAATGAIINELFDASLVGLREDGVVIYHPALIEMMPTDISFSSASFQSRDNVIPIGVSRSA